MEALENYLDSFRVNTSTKKFYLNRWVKMIKKCEYPEAICEDVNNTISNLFIRMKRKRKEENKLEPLKKKREKPATKGAFETIKDLVDTPFEMQFEILMFAGIKEIARSRRTNKNFKNFIDEQIDRSFTVLETKLTDIIIKVKSIKNKTKNSDDLIFDALFKYLFVDSLKKKELKKKFEIYNQLPFLITNYKKDLYKLFEKYEKSKLLMDFLNPAIKELNINRNLYKTKDPLYQLYGKYNKDDLKIFYISQMKLDKIPKLNYKFLKFDDIFYFKKLILYNFYEEDVVGGTIDLKMVTISGLKFLEELEINMDESFKNGIFKPIKIKALPNLKLLKATHYSRLMIDTNIKNQIEYLYIYNGHQVNLSEYKNIEGLYMHDKRFSLGNDKVRAPTYWQFSLLNKKIEVLKIDPLYSPHSDYRLKIKNKSIKNLNIFTGPIHTIDLSTMDKLENVTLSSNYKEVSNIKAFGKCIISLPKEKLKYASIKCKSLIFPDGINRLKTLIMYIANDTNFTMSNFPDLYELQYKKRFISLSPSLNLKKIKLYGSDITFKNSIKDKKFEEITLNADNIELRGNITTYDLNVDFKKYKNKNAKIISTNLYTNNIKFLPLVTSKRLYWKEKKSKFINIKNIKNFIFYSSKYYNKQYEFNNCENIESIKSIISERGDSSNELYFSKCKFEILNISVLKNERNSIIIENCSYQKINWFGTKINDVIISNENNLPSGIDLKKHDISLLINNNIAVFVPYEDRSEKFDMHYIIEIDDEKREKFIKLFKVEKYLAFQIRRELTKYLSESKKIKKSLDISSHGWEFKYLDIVSKMDNSDDNEDEDVEEEEDEDVEEEEDEDAEEEEDDIDVDSDE